MKLYIRLLSALILMLLQAFFMVQAQSFEFCGGAKIHSHALEKGSIEKEIASFQQAQMHSGGTTHTHVVRLFVWIAAETNGNNQVCTELDVTETIRHTKTFFERHGICLQLVGIGRIDDGNLIDIKTDAGLKKYVREDCLNMFVVKSIYLDGQYWGGMAFDIPNNYFAVSAEHVNARNPDAVTAHEIGHCFGLLHTFETARGVENVTRNPNNSCFDCEDDGDYLCDTPADPHDLIADDKEIKIEDHVNSLCLYTGGFTDACEGAKYVPEVRNVMSYTPLRCSLLFSSGQGARMRYHLNNDSDLEDMLVKPTLLLTSFNPLASFYSARDLIIIQSLGHYSAMPIVNLDYLAPNIMISNNATFSVNNTIQDIRITTDTRCN